MKFSGNIAAAAVCIFASGYSLVVHAEHPMLDKVIERYNNNITWQQAKDKVLAPKDLFVVKADGKYGLLGRNGDQILPAEYDKIAKFNEKSLFVKKDGKDGLTDLSGKVIIPVEYDELQPFLDGLILLEKDGKQGISDGSGRLVIPAAYDRIYLYNDKFYVENEDRHGVLAKDGHTIWPCNYERAADSGSGGYIIGSKEAYAYYDGKGKQITPSEFAEARPFHEGLAAVKKGGLFGYIDEQGRMALEPQFTQAWNFREGAAYVEKNEQHYFIDKQGNKLFDAPEGDYFMGFREGSAVFKDDGRFKFIDHQGQELFNIEAATYMKRPNGMIAITRTRHNFSLGGFLTSAITMIVGVPTIPGVTKGLYDTNVKLGYTDAEGREIIPTVHDFNSHIIDDKIITIINDKAGILNLDGSFYVPAAYDDMSDFDWDGNRIVAVRSEKNYGFYKAGQQMLSDGYLYAENFVNGLAPVQLTESRWSYVDMAGNYLSTDKYWVHTTPFYGDFAVVKNLDGRYAIINRRGDEITLLSKDLQEVQALYPDTAIVKKNDKYGVIDTSGTYLVKPQYDAVGYLY